FPFLSPATSIPTLPPRRLVDAGYYDNYGLDVALGYVERGSEKPLDEAIGPTHLLNYTDDVVLINIRPYMITKAVQSALTQDEFMVRDEFPPLEEGKTRSDKKYYLPSLSDPLAPMSGPPEGGEAARRTGMVARTNTLLEVTKSIPTASHVATNAKVTAISPE